MPKYAIRTATALALVATLSLIAVSLLTTGARNATAFNASGSDGAISISAQYAAQCSNGVAVPNPASNAGLVSDCATLLASKTTLEGTTGYLNWSADRAISGWYGVTTANNRVSKLRLTREGMNGAIPAELGNLANLRQLTILTNGLTGAIPAELGNLANLRQLHLWGNDLTGAIPPELGNLSNLRQLHLWNNDLTGAIPAELGNLAKLEDLDLIHNRLTGEIPSELGNLANLRTLGLYGNYFTGCVPASLRALLGEREIQRIGLPICGAATAATPTPSPTSAPANPIPTPTLAATSTATPAIVIEPTPTATSAPGATATLTPIPTLTPAATSAPPVAATPTPPPTPAATSAASGDVMDKLDALGRQVADNSDLSRQVAEIRAAMADLIAAMTARIAELEGNSGQGATTATPTPTPTPAIVIEPTPTATPAIAIEATATATTTPSPTPTGVAAIERPPAACAQSLGDNFTGSYSIGWWAPGCVSANPPRNLTYYARFYTFTLRSAAQATITLSSDDAAPYLYLLNGAGRDGSIKSETGSATASAAMISMSLQPGAYTIEATTWHSETAGDFTLELEIAR